MMIGGCAAAVMLASGLAAAEASPCRLGADELAKARWECSQSEGNPPAEHARAIATGGNPECSEGTWEPDRRACVVCPEHWQLSRDTKSGTLVCQDYDEGDSRSDPGRNTRSTSQGRYRYARPTEAGQGTCFGWLGLAARYDTASQRCVSCPSGYELTGNALESEVACRKLPSCVTSLRSGHYGWYCGRWTSSRMPPADGVVLDRVDCACRDTLRAAEEGRSSCPPAELRSRLERLLSEGSVPHGPERIALDHLLEAARHGEAGCRQGP